MPGWRGGKVEGSEMSGVNGWWVGGWESGG